MKKALLITLFLVLFLIPVLASAQAPFVRCGNNIEYIKNPDGTTTCKGCCTICDFFVTLGRIYNFLVLDVATPLAIIALIIGGIFLLISAGNPNLHGTGKKIMYAAIIGLALVFGSWLIINTILTVLGYNMGTWWNPDLKC